MGIADHISIFLFFFVWGLEKRKGMLSCSFSIFYYEIEKRKTKGRYIHGPSFYMCLWIQIPVRFPQVRVCRLAPVHLWRAPTNGSAPFSKVHRRWPRTKQGPTSLCWVYHTESTIRGYDREIQRSKAMLFVDRVLNNLSNRHSCWEWQLSSSAKPGSKTLVCLGEPAVLRTPFCHSTFMIL